ncbi:MAG: hypothetical protein HDQ88_01145 [Clostridia bacterium]|nr:hypothetical protein [Clostridia bacterium]
MKIRTSIYAKLLVKVQNDESLTREDRWERTFAIYNCAKNTQKILEKYDKKLSKKFNAKIYLKREGILYKLRRAYLGLAEVLPEDIDKEIEDSLEFYKQINYPF